MDHFGRDIRQMAKGLSMPSTESLPLWIRGGKRRSVSIYTTELSMFARSFHNQLAFRGSEGVGIAHWGVVLGDDVIELRTEPRRSGLRNRLFKIERGTLSSGRYDGSHLIQHTIGKTVASHSRIEGIRTVLESIGGGEYDFYRNNCQLIAGALAVAVSEKPDEAFRKLDSLHFINRNHRAQIRDLLKEILPRSTYERYFGQADSQHSGSAPACHRPGHGTKTHSPAPSGRPAHHRPGHREETHSPAAPLRRLEHKQETRTPAPAGPPARAVLCKRRPSPRRANRFDPPRRPLTAENSPRPYSRCWSMQ